MISLKKFSINQNSLDILNKIKLILDNPDEREMEIIFDESLMITGNEKSMGEIKICI